jgi:hypothetical protein
MTAPHCTRRRCATSATYPPSSTSTSRCLEPPPLNPPYPLHPLALASEATCRMSVDKPSPCRALVDALVDAATAPRPPPPPTPPQPSPCRARAWWRVPPTRTGSSTALRRGGPRSQRVASLTPAAAAAAAATRRGQWSERLEEELYRQGDLERTLGLPISTLMDRYAYPPPGPVVFTSMH